MEKKIWKIAIPVFIALALAIITATIVAALEPPMPPTVIVYEQTTISLAEIIAFFLIIAGTLFRTWEGWNEYKKTHPDVKFDSTYLRTAFITSLTAFLIFSVNPPPLVGTKSILIWGVTVFLFAYSGDLALNNRVDKLKNSK